MNRRVPFVASLCLLAVVLFGACASNRIGVRLPQSFRIVECEDPALEARAREQIEDLHFQPVFNNRRLSFNGELVIKTVKATKKDRRGSPFWRTHPGAEKGSNGVTVFTGKDRPVVLILAVNEDGSWDERALRHECGHVVLFWNGIKGHPREYSRVLPRWY